MGVASFAMSTPNLLRQEDDTFKEHSLGKWQLVARVRKRCHPSCPPAPNQAETFVGRVGVGDPSLVVNSASVKDEWIPKSCRPTLFVALSPSHAPEELETHDDTD